MTRQEAAELLRDTKTGARMDRPYDPSVAEISPKAHREGRARRNWIGRDVEEIADALAAGGLDRSHDGYLAGRVVERERRRIFDAIERTRK